MLGGEQEEGDRGGWYQCNCRISWAGVALCISCYRRNKGVGRNSWRALGVFAKERKNEIR